MKFYLIHLPVLITILFSCKQSNTTSTPYTSCSLDGRFFNRTVLNQCPGKVPAEVPYYALELTFKAKDSVDINNGVERHRFPYVKTEKDCNYKIAKATRFGDMFFSVVNDTTLHLFDSAWTRIMSESIFVKGGMSNREGWNFKNYFNECMIAGSYVTKGERGNEVPVYFLPNGQVSGLRPFLGYELCYAGDCLGESGSHEHLIEFMDDRGARQQFVYRLTDGRKLIQFYKIGDPKPGIKENRSIGDLAFEITSPMNNR